jgi:hypothetical protein
MTNSVKTPKKLTKMRLILPRNLVEYIRIVEDEYATTFEDILAAYLYYLSQHNTPIGYPKRVVRESKATDQDRDDINTLIIKDHETVRFPKYFHNE